MVVPYSPKIISSTYVSVTGVGNNIGKKITLCNLGKISPLAAQIRVVSQDIFESKLNPEGNSQIRSQVTASTSEGGTKISQPSISTTPLVTKANKGSKEKHPCKLCPIVLTRAHTLRRHMENMHKNKGKKYNCPKCKEMFTRKDNLKTHILGHSNTKEFKCALCPAAFKFKPYLKRHLRKYHPKEQIEPLKIEEDTELLQLNKEKEALCDIKETLLKHKNLLEEYIKLQEKLEVLLKENIKLQEENEVLLKENIKLQEENEVLLKERNMALRFGERLLVDRSVLEMRLGYMALTLRNVEVMQWWSRVSGTENNVVENTSNL